MIDSLLLRWALTVALATATLWPVTGHRRSRADAATFWISSAAHVLVGGAMIAMLWPWGGIVPGGLEITVFAVTAAWFFRLGTVPRPAPRWPDLHHAIMAVAMIWMTLAMPATELPVTGMAGHRHGDLPSSVGMPTLLLLAGVVLAGYFLLAVVPWLSRATLDLRATGAAGTPRRHRHAFEAAGHALSSAAMGVLVLAAL
jgi:hypothetical protein